MQRDTAKQVTEYFSNARHFTSHGISRANRITTDDDGDVLPTGHLDRLIPRERRYHVTATTAVNLNYHDDPISFNTTIPDVPKYTQLDIDIITNAATADITPRERSDLDAVDDTPEFIGLRLVVWGLHEGDPLTDDEQQLYDLYTDLRNVTGITDHRAANIAAEYETWDALTEATRAELKAIPRIGDVTADTIRTYIDTERPAPNADTPGSTIPHSDLL